MYEKEHPNDCKLLELQQKFWKLIWEFWELLHKLYRKTLMGVLGTFMEVQETPTKASRTLMDV